MDENGNPTLDNERTVRAIQFVLDLRDKYKIIPKEGDYEIADMLFKEQRTAMIINGPWSWGGYHVPAKSMVAPLPFNSETGLVVRADDLGEGLFGERERAGARSSRSSAT